MFAENAKPKKGDKMTKFKTTPRKRQRALDIQIPAENRDELISKGWKIGDPVNVELSVKGEGK